MINWLRSDLENSKDKNLLSDQTLLLAEISDDELKQYGLLESLEALKKSSKASINSFHEIGWIDPFPKLSAQQMTKKGKWGKKGKKKERAKSPEPSTMSEAKQMAIEYLEAIDDPELMKPILSLALPSRILLFKIMRACIAVRRKSDLWMYVDPFA